MSVKAYLTIVVCVPAMPVLSARGVSKAYGPQTLFSNVSLTITRGERVGLLGINGTGKSTLLRVLAGVEPADEGTIDRRRESTILFLDQEPHLDPEKSPRQLVEEGLAEWKAAISRHAEISKRIEAGETDLIEEQSHLGELVERLGGWSRDHVCEDMLSKLGVRDIERPVGTMSGGEQRRVALARVLVARPTLAILDEPTNHLDTFTIDWLEKYFAEEYDGAILMVTHDRYVLDAICDRIIELDRGELTAYQGGYSDFLEQKAERLAHEERTEANRLNLLRRETAWLRRQPKARSTKQKARIKRAQVLIGDEPPPPPPRVDFGGLEAGASELGKQVLDLEGIELVVGGKTLVKGLDLRLMGRDRIGIIGPNGAGKTSLLRAIVGDLEPAKGKITVPARTRIALFDQQRAQLRDDWSVLDNVCEREHSDKTGAGVVSIGKETMAMRSYLELFSFDGSKQRQKVGSLSGGERARVALAKILRNGSNLLLLDEPTNDLDVATLASLEDLLESWPGCVLAVSHDRYFLDRVATSMLSFEADGKVIRYPGNYTTYLSQRKAPSIPPPPKAIKPATGKPSSSSKLTSAERKEYDGILDRIAIAEAKVETIEAALADPNLYATNADKAKSLTWDLEEAKRDVAKLIARWESLEAKLS